MILLIDDSDLERALIRKMLESGGHEVREAAGGDEGLALFGAAPSALVLCDLMMPGKDGFATVADMQSLAPQAKIIAMSGVWYGKSDHAAAAKALGLAAVIEKPFEREQLLRLVARTLEPKARSRRAAARKSPTKAKSKPKSKPKRRPKATSKRHLKRRPKQRPKRR